MKLRRSFPIAILSEHFIFVPPYFLAVRNQFTEKCKHHEAITSPPSWYRRQG